MGEFYRFEKSNYTFEVLNAYMNCDTKNCIYVINCPHCDLIYIGETCDLKARMNVHRNHNKSENAPLFVNQHIAKHTRTMDVEFKVMPFF